MSRTGYNATNGLGKDALSRLDNQAKDRCAAVISQTMTLKDMLDRHGPCKDLLDLMINKDCNSTPLDIADFSRNELACLLGCHGVKFTLIEGHYQTFESLTF